MDQTLRKDISAGQSELIDVAQYIRMSTGDQQYSPANQDDVNTSYAQTHRMVIVSTYYDRGKSGLNIERRPALRRLIEDIVTGAVNFRAILVYDVSRWGRYQDPDEAAHYEFLCKRAGIAVHYPAEQFENDGSTASTILKGLKRVMAAEFSRDLSAKVFAGQARMARKGYLLGSSGYGLRRLLVDQTGKPRGILESGEWKSITTDRILLVPGPQEEIDVVREIFSLFVHHRKFERQIANILNARGLTNGFGRPWKKTYVFNILCHERYIGNIVWNRSSYKLQAVRLDNDPEAWIRVEGAFAGIVERSLFDAAQERFRTRGWFTKCGRPARLSDEEMLEGLRTLLQEHGTLNWKIIDENGRTPSAMTYYNRFGSIKAAYQLIGFRQLQRNLTPGTGRPRGLSDEEMLDGLRRLWRDRGYLSQELIQASKHLPSTGAYILRFGNMARVYDLIGFKHDANRYHPRHNPLGTSDEKLLDIFRELLRKEGRLSCSIIESCPQAPCHGTIDNRFGGLIQLYKRLGYEPDRYYVRPASVRNLSDEEMLDGLRALGRERGYLSAKLIISTKSLPSIQTYRKRFGTLPAAYKRIGYLRGRQYVE